MKIQFTSFLILLYFTLSAQSQITWITSLNVATGYSNMHPRMAINGSGNPIVIWGRMSDQSVLFSRWTGTTFTTPVKLNPNWMQVATASWMGPDIAAKGDTVYIVMKRFPEAADTNRIFIIRSLDGGITFSPPVELAIIADSVSRFPTVTVDNTGNPVVAFMKFDPSFLNARWVVSRSNDYGNTFTNDVLASGWSGGDVCDCCPGSIENSGNNVLVTYRDNNNNIRDTWSGISTDNGNTFSTGMNVDQNNWMIASCPATGPDAVIIGDSLYSVFMSSATGAARVYLSKSSISAATGSLGNLLTGNISGLTMQNYPRIATDGYAAAIGWTQMVNGTQQFALKFTNNIANGFPVSYDTVDLANVTNVDVALTDGNIFVVWEDDNSGTVKFRHGTFNSISTTIAENFDEPFSVFPNPVSSKLKVESKNILHEVTIEIEDIFGRIVFKQKAISFSKTEIDVSEFKTGNYFLRITSGSKFYSKVFLKN